MINTQEDRFHIKHRLVKKYEINYFSNKIDGTNESEFGPEILLYVPTPTIFVSSLLVLLINT